MDTFYEKKHIVLLLVTLVCLVYIGRLFYIQVVNTNYKNSAANNSRRYVTQYPARGLIYDRNGELLVFNEVAYDLKVIPRQINNLDTSLFCKILDIEKDQLINELTKAKKYSKYKPSVIIKQIPAKRYAILQEFLYRFPGFYVQTRTIRKYPEKIAAHVLGYVGEVNERTIKKNPYYEQGDYIGVSGIERSYEKNLRGKKGSKIYLVDVHNRIQGSYQDGALDTAARAGDNITTTIHAGLQAYGELLMQNKKGSIVAIEPETGEILALVTSPSYDPNLLVGRIRSKNYKQLATNKYKPLFNRALMAQYPPGSTFKTVNALIGLQEEVITTESVFTCAGGYHVGTFTVGCHHGGAINFVYSIQGSCNAYYCHVFRRILDDRKYGSVDKAYVNWRNHLSKFGLGRKLNSDLPMDSKGFIPDTAYFNRYYGYKRWKSLMLISMAIGQGELGLTPFQMANMTAILANRGYYRIPHVVKAINGENAIAPRFKKVNFTDIDPKHFTKVVDAMELVVKAGTAMSAQINGISVCGKTGTAENPHGKDHSIFIAFAPKENPKIALSVYVENGGFGSTWAAPIASLMIEKYLTDSISRPIMEKQMLDANLLEEQKPKVIVQNMEE